MLAFTLSVPPKTSLNSYLRSPDISDNQFETRGNGETNAFLCDKGIKLTEELVLFLHYFSATSDKNIIHTLKSFSNLPIKEA